jgi:hypothetical protein
MPPSKAALTAMKRLSELRPALERKAQLRELYEAKFGRVPLNAPHSDAVPTFADWAKTLPQDFDPTQELQKFARGGLAQLKDCSCHQKR